MDFSSANLRYLLALRDLARSDPHIAGLIVGVPDALTEAVAELDDEWLLRVAAQRSPVMFPHRDVTWWQRLAEAARDGNDEEVTSLLENHAYRVTNGETR